MEPALDTTRHALILCTDESTPDAERVRELAAAAGYDVQLARPGADAVGGVWDLVLVASAHPLVAQGALRVRHVAGTATAPVVAFGPADDEARTDLRGFDAFLKTPVGADAAELLATLAANAKRGRIDALEREVQTLAGRNERLSEEVRERAGFLATLTHELATPLTPLMGYLKLLRSGRLGPLTDKQQQALQAMAHAAERLEHSLDNLVDYASLQTGQDRVHLADLDAAALVDQCVQSLHTKARAKHVLLDARHPKAAPVKGDERKLRQALANIIDNALRFSPHGGHVLVQLTDGAEQVLFAVYDQGPGLPADAQHAPSLAWRDEKASAISGLGLPVTRQIVEAHHGSLVLESPPREQPDARELFTGSKVGFWIPKVA